MKKINDLTKSAGKSWEKTSKLIGWYMSDMDLEKNKESKATIARVLLYIFTPFLSAVPLRAW
jgi:hypothetical protein